MTVAVSGASSFIGLKLIKLLSSMGHICIAIVREESASKVQQLCPDSVKTVVCEMSDYSELGSLVGMVDCYVHLAWNGTRGDSRMDERLQKNNFECGVNAVSSMLRSGCKKVLSAGSQAEYGIIDGIISETSICRPNTSYGRYKLEFYYAVKSLCKRYGASFLEPRFFSLYGPNDNPNTMIISILKCLLSGESCRLTKGIQMWDFLYIDDAIDAFAQLCIKDCRSGVYNFGSGDCRPLRSFVEEMKHITHSNSDLLFGAVPYSAAGIVSIRPDISKLIREIGWQPKTTFEAGVRIIIASFENEENS